MANPGHESALWNVASSGTPPNLSGFDLSGVRRSSVRLEGANLSGADLRGADLSGGYFRGCNLSGAGLNKARITLGDFREADLSGADLTAAELTGSVLSGARLSGANLSRTRLVKTRLEGVDLTGAKLDRTDLRGAQGLTAEQLASARDSDKVILDERMLAALGRSAEVATARHGLKAPQRAQKEQVDLLFGAARPSFGDLFRVCGKEHSRFPPTGQFGFEALADLGFRQVDDYFALCVDEEPVIWLYPLVGGRVMAHHPGPYDGVRLELGMRSYKRRWSTCVERFREALRLEI